MEIDKPVWGTTVPERLMLCDEVHVWRAHLKTSGVDIEQLSTLLSVDELERASRFHFESDKNRFVAFRGILRNILSHYLGMNPQDILFDYTSEGKPVIAHAAVKVQHHFNVSHSGDFALYVVSAGPNVGIDIERVRNDISIEQISKNFYTPKEIVALNATGETDRRNLFFRYWTRKEALLKGTGKGISSPMDRCDVALVNPHELSPVILSENNFSSCWYVRDLFPGHGCVASVAIDRPDCNVSCWQYSFQK